MALPKEKCRWILYILSIFFLLVIVNRWIVMPAVSDVWRARLMRFQLTCIFQIFMFFMSLFVWTQTSALFDRTLTNTDTEKFINMLKLLDVKTVFNWKRYSLASKIWRIILLTVLVSAHFAYSTFSFLISTNPYTISLWLFLCLAILIQLFSGLIIATILTYILKLLLGNRSRAIVGHTKLKPAIVVIYAGFIVSAGHYNSYLPPQIKEVTIPVKDLPADLNQMTITFIPDIHLGPTVGKSRLEKIVHTVNYMHSDMVVIGGDLVDGYVTQLHEAVEPLEWVKSKYGTYYVTGNHEYYTTDVHNWFMKLKSLGVKVLHNTNVWLPSDTNRGLCLAGVDDPTADSYRFMDHTMDLDSALRSCDKSSPVVLVAHQPSVAKIALESEHRVDLVLSGHTHGGQMFPLIIGAYLFNPYYAGLYPHGDNSHVYVSMGTFYWGFPVRFWTRSEISKITLVQRDEKQSK